MPMERTKLRVVNKLLDSGYDTEKKITGMDTPMMIAIKSITIPEVQIILELQKAIKDRKIFEYLREAAADEKPEGESNDESMKNVKEAAEREESDEEYPSDDDSNSYNDESEDRSNGYFDY